MDRLINFIGLITTEILLFIKDPAVLIVVPVLALTVLLDACGVTQ